MTATEAIMCEIEDMQKQVAQQGITEMPMFEIGLNIYHYLVHNIFTEEHHWTVQNEKKDEIRIIGYNNNGRKFTVARKLDMTLLGQLV